MASTPEMVDSVKAFILSDKKDTLKNISDQVKISVSKAHKFMGGYLASS